MKDLTLYSYWRSSCSWRVRWALNHKGLSYKYQAVNLLNGEQRLDTYTQMNPAQLVPALQVAGRVLTGSLAILEWLEEVFPEKPLLPNAPDDRAVVRELAHTIAVDVQPVQNLRVQKYVSHDQAVKQAFASHWIERGFATFESLLQKHGFAGQFSCGSEVSLADICLIPQVYNANRFGVAMNAFPEIQRIYQNALKLKSCEDAYPDNQPDAVK